MFNSPGADYIMSEFTADLLVDNITRTSPDLPFTTIGDGIKVPSPTYTM